jgi:DNA modification methylase
MEIERWEIGRVKPYEKNPRKNKRAIEKAADSIREFGWRQPIVVDENDVIVVGHTRLAAAKHLGLEEVPVHRATDLTPDQVRAYRIADNKTGEYATWDPELLGDELRLLKASDYDLMRTGFSVGELRKFTDTTPEEKPTGHEKAPERAALGDVWILGEHRLAVGDCTDVEVARSAFGKYRPGLMVTDPPYGVDYDPTWRQTAAEAGTIEFKGRTHKRAMSKVANDDQVEWPDAFRHFPGDVAYVWHAGTRSMGAAHSLLIMGFEIRAQIIWNKPSLVIGRGHYHHKHEPCFYAVRKGKQGHWGGSRNESTVWDIAPEKFISDHPTQKPVECMLRPIRNHEIRTVFDPFIGTGSTLIACEHEGRRCIGIEKEPRWADVIIERWEQFAKKEAVKE